MEVRREFKLNYWGNAYVRINTVCHQYLCGSGVRELWKLPVDVMELDLVFSDQPHPAAYKVLGVYWGSVVLESKRGKPFSVELYRSVALMLRRLRLKLPYYVRVEY